MCAVVEDDITREVEEAVRTQVGAKVRGVRRVRVRFVPKETTTTEFDEFIPGDVSPKSSPEPEEDEHNCEKLDPKGVNTRIMRSANPCYKFDMYNCPAFYFTIIALNEGGSVNTKCMSEYQRGNSLLFPSLSS